MEHHDYRLGSGKNFIAITLSDTTDIIITDSTLTDQQANDFDVSRDCYPRGFHCNANGTIYIDDASGQCINSPITLTAGNTYWYSFKRFRLTGACGITHGSIIAFR